MRTTKTIIRDALAKELPAAEQQIAAALTAPQGAAAQTQRTPRERAEDVLGRLRAACDDYDAVKAALERAAQDVLEEHNKPATPTPKP